MRYQDKYNYGKPKEVPLATGRVAASTDHYDIWEYPVVLPNGGAAIYEVCVRQDAAMIIAEQDGKIVLTKQVQQRGGIPRYCLLGGMIENGEHPLHAAKRELAEESGLTSDDWELVAEVRHNNRMIWSDYLFIARNCKKTTEVHLDAGEQIDLIRVTPSEFMTQILLSENFREKFVKDVLIKTPSPSDIQRFEKMTQVCEHIFLQENVINK